MTDDRNKDHHRGQQCFRCKRQHCFEDGIDKPGMLGHADSQHRHQHHAQWMKADKVLGHLRKKVGKLLQRQQIDDADRVLLSWQCFGKRHWRTHC